MRAYEFGEHRVAVVRGATLHVPVAVLRRGPFPKRRKHFFTEEP